eukprot:SAG11_NODE_9_length_28972_cov_81.532539_17_plen_133_part_00
MRLTTRVRELDNPARHTAGRCDGGWRWRAECGLLAAGRPTHVSGAHAQRAPLDRGWRVRGWTDRRSAAYVRSAVSHCNGGALCGAVGWTSQSAGRTERGGGGGGLAEVDEAEAPTVDESHAIDSAEALKHSA